MKRKEPYFLTASLKQLIDQLEGQAFFVGGCVRDFLMHRTIGDIDMATPFTPDQVCQKLSPLHIRIIPTGIQYGTLTLLLKDGQKVEITSFRKDIRTDGRHAVVEFGTSMQEDSKRRDLTINALYMDQNGQIFDFVHGLKDLKHKNICFIGDANRRIQEDALRILRFFRFYGLFSTAYPSDDAIRACRHLKDLLSNISDERIKDEIFKILSLSDPYKALYLMRKTGILNKICQQKTNLNALRQLVSREKKVGRQASALFRAWILCGKNVPPFKLSKNEKQTISQWINADQRSFCSTYDFLAILFLYGRQTLLDMTLYKKKNLNFPCFQYISHLESPTCPFTPIDIMNYCHVSGDEITKMYQKAVDIWINQKFSKKDVVFYFISQ